ncbi:YbdK family carboxylate-amine ligase [Herminiimonas sp. CN]|uniref:YbdK family carboxylate-amine ligase n=1 Tax=Herminiimonas sp. CN TaxID=1349818 RepID=UPI0004742C5F|nr:YbdK family carboxylate-amine ligase [Herminiimonas sp. CN]
MLDFTSSAPLTMGVELELQVVNRLDYNLTRGCPDLLAVLGKTEHGYDIKPEITESMIEIATSVHVNHRAMLAELTAMRTLLVAAADKINLGLAGGGAHPFQHWEEQRITPVARYHLVSELYGYLAKQFTVYGQHIHVGCADGDEAVRLTHLLARYIPHFIALSASSPFYQGVDTAFQSSRLTSINAFPLSGCMPFVHSWDEFNAYYQKMASLNIVASMKDFYWDIRPKPEYGTVEIRVCDTPLGIEAAVQLAAYAQTLCKYFLDHRELSPVQDIYLTYSYNRFQSCRFGLAGVVIDPIRNAQLPIKDDILHTLDMLGETARELGTDDVITTLRESAIKGNSDADWLRAAYAETGSLSEVVRRQAQAWMSNS